MDLGIRGKQAIVCAASKGLGRACALALAREGVDVVINARGAEALNETASAISALGAGSVRTVAADVTTPEGRAQLLEACPQPDILINNAGGPPAGDFRDWDLDIWQQAVQANMLTPILLIRAVVDGMIARSFGRIVNITSGAVKSPIAVLGLSNGARAGLTGFCAGLAREVAAHNVTINNLLPGPFDTDRLRGNLEMTARKEGISTDEMARRRAQANPARRFGQPEEFGEFCAFLCSEKAGYLVGQNILLDGGSFNSTF